MTLVEAEAASLEIVNWLSNLIAALPVDAPFAARQALAEAGYSVRKAADALASAAENGAQGDLSRGDPL